jgi:dTDP-4-amino-4,6-dideoxygalactose transaminase
MLAKPARPSAARELRRLLHDSDGTGLWVTWHMPSMPPNAMTATARDVIPLFDLVLEDEDVAAVVDALRSGWLTMGPRIQAFEEAFAEHLGVPHAIATSSCTTALHLAYLAAGVEPGDEVIVPSMTFVATANAAVYCGARPVFAEIIDRARPVLDPGDVEARITSRTNAVVAVHVAGYAAPVAELAELCEQRGIALLEDAAHAPTGELRGRALGTWGLAGAFSFFSNKVLSVGEGGLLATANDEVAKRARSLRSHAMTSGTWDRHRGHADTYDVVDIGFNYRMDEPRAALALSRLRHMRADVENRRRLTLAYRERLRDQSGLILPFDDADVASAACYVMPVMLEDAGRQSSVRRELRERHRVQTSVLYPAVHEFSVYAERFPRVSLPRTELAARSEVTIPLYPHMTEAEQERVIAGLKEALDANASR